VGDNKVAIISASLGGFDGTYEHTSQTYSHDYFLFTDANFPPRVSLTPRLQAKIPKLFAYQLKPNYDYYLWLDGHITLNNPNTLTYLMSEIQSTDILVFQHPRRPNVRQEIRYLRKGLREQSRYLVSRYNGEFLPEQTREYEQDKFEDDLLAMGGVFLYRNTPEVQALLKEWWYHITRYNIQDQISFSYVLKKSNLKIKVLTHDFNTWDYIKLNGHAKRYA
jgi:hypothetical protein